MIYCENTQETFTEIYVRISIRKNEVFSILLYKSMVYNDFELFKL